MKQIILRSYDFIDAKLGPCPCAVGSYCDVKTRYVYVPGY